ncbi:MAG: ABC transporter ATP-binding protein [Elusimicrobiota bacterium]|nr:ABC transporter ATP-binding protein [Elusimicrobiota bacterium]
MPKLLEVRDLRVRFDGEAGPVRVVRGVSFDLERGATLGIVGESGSGKSVTALSVMRLLPKPAGVIESGSVFLEGRDLAALTPAEMSKVRGNRISMIFQEPMTALNPVHTVRRQLAESYELHHPEMNAAQVAEASLQMLKDVGIPDPSKRLDEYPHQLSGGMRQRVMISIALACRPDVLIADEPTTALDVTIQAQILKLIKRLQREHGMAVLFITHDLGVIAEICDEVAVMYAGQVVERATAKELFASPRHPYTSGLLASIPRLDSVRKTLLKTIEGMVPDFSSLPRGCAFSNRCEMAVDACAEPPMLAPAGGERLSRCPRWEDMK